MCLIFYSLKTSFYLKVGFSPKWFFNFDIIFSKIGSLLDRIKLKKGHLTRDQLKWILSTSKKLRERAAVLKLEEEVRELKETLFYARKKNKEIKRVIKKNEQKLSKMVNNSTTQEGDSCSSPEQLLYSLKFPQQSNPLNLTYSWTLLSNSLYTDHVMVKWISQQNRTELLKIPKSVFHFVNHIHTVCLLIFLPLLKEF